MLVVRYGKKGLAGKLALGRRSIFFLGSNVSHSQICPHLVQLPPVVSPAMPPKTPVKGAAKASRTPAASSSIKSLYLISYNLASCLSWFYCFYRLSSHVITAVAHNTDTQQSMLQKVAEASSTSFAEYVASYILSGKDVADSMQVLTECALCLAAIQLWPRRATGADCCIARDCARSLGFGVSIPVLLSSFS